jgi:hypothetical protein
MPRLTQRPKRLSKRTIRGWVEEHIPYRVESLERATSWAFNSGAERDAALVHARWCIELLGLSKSKGKLKIDDDYFSLDGGKTSDAVKAADLGGANVDPSKLRHKQRKILLTLMARADKAVAHPTCGKSGRMNSKRNQAAYDLETKHALKDGAKILLELLNKNIGAKNHVTFGLSQLASREEKS